MPALLSVSGVANIGHVRSVGTEIVYGDISEIYDLKIILTETFFLMYFNGNWDVFKYMVSPS